MSSGTATTTRRTVARRLLGVALGLLVVLALPATAWAHVPFIESAQRSDARGTRDVPYPQAQTIPPPTISRAIYGYLAPGAQFDSYTFTVPHEVTTEVSLIVPKRVGLETFQPRLRIYAEGSDTALTVSDPGDQPRSSFYEPFSIASFWSGPTATTTFKPNERYYVVINPPATGRQSGAYVLTFGGAEEFSAGDWLNTAGAMPTIWLGSWSGGPARPGAYVCGVVFVLLLVLVVWLWFWRRKRKAVRALAEAEDAAHVDAASAAPATPEPPVDDTVGAGEDASESGDAADDESTTAPR